MVSEDSESSGWLSMVHRLDDLRYFNQPATGQVMPAVHQMHDVRKLVEVGALRGTELMGLEEGNNHITKVDEPIRGVSEQVLPVVVVSPVAVHPAATEELDEVMKDRHA